VPAEGGAPTRLAAVSAATQTAGFIVRPMEGQAGRVYYTESSASRAAGGRRFTVLRSIAPGGGDRRDHLRFRFASDVALSPDGKWVALEENGDIYLTPAPAGRAAGSEAPLVDAAGAGSTRLTRAGGYSPRWRDATTLEFGNADRHYVHRVGTGRTDTIRIELAVPRDVARGSIALVDARIVPLDSTRRVIEHGSVVARNGRITCVGRCDVAGIDRVIDAGGKTIIPGLIDMHAHSRSPALGIIPPQSYEYALFLAYGVTTAREAFGLPQHDFAAAELIEAGAVIGSRTFNVGGGIIPVPYGSGIGAAVSGVGPFYDVPTLSAAEGHIARIRSWGAVALKNYYQPARDRRQALIEAARRAGFTATAENDDLYYVLGFVMDGNAGFEHSIRNLPLYGDAARFLGQARIVYSSTLIAGTGSQRGKDSWVQALDTWLEPKERRWRPWLDFIPTQRRRTLRPLTDYRHPLYAQGVADVIAEGGYGSIGSHGEIGGLGAHLEVWMNASAMSPMQALEVASRHGAYFLGADRDLGTLEVGKLADLLVLDANPLDDIRNTLKIAYVMKGGRLYDDDTLDEVWPRQRPYGPRPWVNEAVLRTDERPVDFHDRR
jgi:hypothetical protein